MSLAKSKINFAFSKVILADSFCWLKGKTHFLALSKIRKAILSEHNTRK